MGFLDLLSPPVCEVEFSNAIAPVGKIGRDIVLMGILFSEGSHEVLSNWWVAIWELRRRWRPEMVACANVWAKLPNQVAR